MDSKSYLGKLSVGYPWSVQVIIVNKSENDLWLVSIENVTEKCNQWDLNFGSVSTQNLSVFIAQNLIHQM